MKKLLIFLLFLSCSSEEVQNIVSTTGDELPLSTSSTSTSTTTTILDSVSEDIIADELQIGNCFNGNGVSGIYLNSEEIINRVPCSSLHEFEVITSINFEASEDTEFNEDGIPNLEIYSKCEESYSKKFGRDIGGTSTYLSWSGSTDNFMEEREYLCFVTIFDYINGPQKLSYPYKKFLNSKTKNYQAKKLFEVTEGECFWKRRPDVDLYYQTEVDVLPCNEVHSHEVVKIYNFPEDNSLVSEIDHYVWAFNSCYSLGGIYRTTTYFVDELEGLGVRTYSMFDNSAFNVGDQTQAICISHLHYGFAPSGRVIDKNMSLTEIYDEWILNNSIDFKEDGNESVVRLSCPTQEEIDQDMYIAGFLFTVVIENRPIQNITFTYVDNEIKYTVDFTDTYKLHGFDNLQVSILVYEAFHLYMLSDRTYEELMKLNSGEDFLESATISVTDQIGNIFEGSCSY